jgi:ribosomal protein L29
VEEDVRSYLMSLKKKYWDLKKEEALDGTVRKTRFGRGRRPVARPRNE